MDRHGKDWVIITMIGHAARNDMDGVLSMLGSEYYSPEFGLEAVGIAMSRRHNSIVYELLSFKNTLDIYKERSSPFMVCTVLEEKLKEYTPLFQCQEPLP